MTKLLDILSLAGWRHSRCRGRVTLALAMMTLIAFVQATPAMAQGATLYQEDPSDPHGKSYNGSVNWRIQKLEGNRGHAADVAVRADIEIPERRMKAVWSLRRNFDPTLPASHTIEVMFTLPGDFPNGGVAEVTDVFMKKEEAAAGARLAEVGVKVTPEYYMFGLSAIDAHVKRNLQLLEDDNWLDIPIVYTDGIHAVLTLTKGAEGGRVFAEALAAWKK
jgi:hypothetical protein